MVAKHLAVALLGSALIAAPALAQTSSGSGAAGSSGATTTTSPSTGAAPTMNNNTGASTSGNASMGASGSTMTQMQPGQWRASQIEGLDVYNQNNEKIGDISEMLVDESGKIQAVVIGVGGFLGIGERDVAISFDQVKFVNEPRANATAANTNTGAPGTATTTAAPNTTGSTAGTTTGSTATTATTADNANRTSPDHAMVNMTKDQLKSMPEFKYNNR
ncbi:PRC-barrel domain-containing protein [Microvirga guangxiensis]|uniref:Sporulation protein YlmC, PRC-barrel domain family n=1 Tax=Microvirga guangxiensis TaxID=549386 RepID=A0A1G5GDL1_9HYPH|nr:PRC-barrel domain-containing protein [Microvirga guangxiensis]SCY49417.1 Sporulation protein YlmC, PRC-barrel domain family [Microvirga guangxiensis]